MDRKTSNDIKEVGRLLALDNKGTYVKEQIAKKLNKLSRKAVDSTQLKPLSGFGNMEFVKFTLDNKVDAKSNLLKYDAQTIINSVSNPDFVPDTVKFLTKQINGSLQLQGLRTIVFDEFDIDDTVKRLNDVDQRTKNIAKYVEFDEDLSIEEIYD